MSSSRQSRRSRLLFPAKCTLDSRSWVGAVPQRPGVLAERTVYLQCVIGSGTTGEILVSRDSVFLII